MQEMSCFINKKRQKIITKTGSTEIEKSQPEKLSGVIIECQLSFENHINNICCKAKA